MGRLLNVIDVEATCWDGTPPPGQVNEIIEVGVCVVDLDARERVERDRIMVRPARSSVSAFCTRLTGITAAEAGAGLAFAEACERLRKVHHADSRPWASWGDYDRKQFQRQCNGPQRYPFGSVHINAKAVFAEAYQSRRQGMAGALGTAGLPLEGRHHNGADDAWNIAALVLHLIGRGQWVEPAAYGV
jgi:inhibitor of KinA sporulation pathway (predicted exonuclease)